jgi:hypothetical protein
MNPKKKEPWRIVVGLLSIAWIIWMWADKDVAAIYAAMPAEDALPLIVTTVAVSAAKVGVIAGAVFLIKWMLAKRK